MRNSFAYCGQLEERLRSLAGREERLQAAAVYLAETFGVEANEVAIFGRDCVFEKESLRFLWPPHLARAASGYIPLSSGNSLAVRTFVERRPFLNLTFASTHHASYFEIVPLDKESGRRAPPIQKIISAPVRRQGGFEGVVQVSHKGETPETAGPDFAAADLDLLVQLGSVLAEYL